MCGIVGYIGTKNCVPLIMEGLKRLEYRGYDSAGLALIKEGKLIIEKKAGKVADLAEMIKGKELSASLGIGHTRWATHGEPDDLNAHPHWDCKGEIAIIHNGIIENYSTLKKKLIQDGHQIRTATDTEILVHLIEEMYKQTRDLFSAVRYALLEVEGTFGILVISPKEPDRIIAARRGSPLVIGVGEGENLIASDAAALVEHTRQVVYLNDDEMACIMADSFYTKTIYDQEVVKQIEKITFSLEQIERGGYEHFMLKEINEQPTSLENAMRGRLMAKEGDVRLGGLHTVMDKLLNARRIIITSCGTSWHAALVGKYMLEQLGRIPVDVDYASEFRFRNPVIRPDDVVMVISQSGETADTLAALREAKSRGVPVLGIVNVVGSTIARETDAGVYNHAGPEIGVASTKAFTSQLSILALLTLFLGRQREMSLVTGKRIAEELAEIPHLMRRILKKANDIKMIAEKYSEYSNFLYLGRKYNYPIAMEGALKIKEISYVHAEGYPFGEMKHGPIALIDKNFPTMAIATSDSVYEKTLSGIQEVKARSGKVIAIATKGDREIQKMVDDVIYIPKTLEMLTPLLSVIPLQLFAYYCAVSKGLDVDKPRNLAKSVTVE